jgi:hypothetical protein
MEAPVEIRYAGVIVGRAQEVRSAEGEDLSFFIPIRDPMPVGTLLRLRSGDKETPARVVHAIESTDATACGMQVRLIGEAEVVAPEFIPAPEPVVENKPATPTPAIEIDLARMEAVTAAASTAEMPTVIMEEPPPFKAEEPVPSQTTETAVTPADAPTAAPDEAVPFAIEPAPAESAEATTLSAPSVDSGASGAVPEAVPTAVGSSMTGALENATQSIPPNGKSKRSRKTEKYGSAHQYSLGKVESELVEPASGKVESAIVELSEGEMESIADESSDGTVESASGENAQLSSESFSDVQPTTENLPPARPIAGPSGRRKTKRRR